MFESLFSRRGLSLDRLRTLLEVHAAGSIAQAVNGNPVRHSQYSRQLRELSEYFGCEVTERHGKYVKLTPQGVRLAEISRQYLVSLEDLSTSVRGERDTFTIAAGDSLMLWLVMPRIGTVLGRLPQVRFATQASRTQDIIRQITDLRVDFGLIRRNAMVHGLRSADLGTLRYTVVVPRMLAQKSRAPTLRQVFQLPLAIQTTDGQFGSQLFEIARSFEPSFEPALTCQSFPQTLAAVRSGRFAAVLPELSTRELAPTTFFSVNGPALRQLDREIVLVWNQRVIGVRPNAEAVATAIETAMRFER
jgi:DNA-binding transcriptional LysR family regulator